MAVLYTDAGDECYIITIEWWYGVEMAWLQPWRGRCNRDMLTCWLVHRTWWPDDGSLSGASAAILANQSCRIRSLIYRQGVAVMVCPYLPWLRRSRSQRERKYLRHGLVSRLRKSLSWSMRIWVEERKGARCGFWLYLFTTINGYSFSVNSWSTFLWTRSSYMMPLRALSRPRAGSSLRSNA